MQRGIQGEWVSVSTAGEEHRAFVPMELPPEPPLVLGPREQDLLEAANRALGRLDGLAMLFPDPTLFLHFYVRKEAVLSSQIEGTQSSLTDLLLFESAQALGVPLSDVREVSRYVAALDHAVDRLRGGFPLSVRLLREAHEVLLAGARGAHRAPGELRRNQNWIGGPRPSSAIFVPPPWTRVESALAALERFLNDIPRRTPTLIKAALAHVQFETIHPFMDGNGRLGRLLITLLLVAEHAVQAPLLYLSLYFKIHRQTYYDLLQSVRLTGDWESWLDFFLRGVVEVADQAAASARQLLALFDADRRRIEQLGRGASRALRVHDHLRRHPIVTIPSTAQALALSAPTVTSALQGLEQLGIVREITGRTRGRTFVYWQHLALMNQGTDLQLSTDAATPAP